MLNLILLQAEAGAQQGSQWTFWVMMALIFVVFYFFMIRPQTKKQKELQSLQKQTKEQRTAALTVQEIRSMGKKTITGNITLTPSECSTLKDYAVNGILTKVENSRLEEKLQSAQKSAAVWKQRYESLKEQARPYLEAVKLAPEKVRAFLDAILTRTRQTKQHDQPSRRKSHDMEL